MTAAEFALLVVDDNEDNRYTLIRRLKREGYTNLTTADDGRQALEVLRSRRFDLVLLDIMMPEMNGYQVLEHLKADPELRNIPVIMISALDEMDSVIRCIELGAEDYLAKPFNPTMLRARVGASLAKKRLRDEVRSSLNRLELELDAARKLQAAMLPSALPAPTHDYPVQVSAVMVPAREVGGDLYDFFPSAEGVYCFLVGDVSGKGASAAMFMARTRSLVRMATDLWRRLAADSLTPARIAEVVNRELCQNNRDRMFVTLFLGFLDTNNGVLKYVNAGHLRPYLLRGSGVIERVDGKPELPLAVRAEAVFRDASLTLLPDDAVFVFSDGVIEAMNVAEEFYGVERLEAALRPVADLKPQEIMSAIRLQIDAFTEGAPKGDDVTILALRWLGTTEKRHFGVTGKSAVPVLFPQTTHLVIRNDVADLESVSRAMEQIGAEHGVPETSVTHLQVAVDEMVSNVIKYAWPDREAHDIEIRITVDSESVKIEIIDDGQTFNPLAAPEPVKVSPGQKPRPGGLGVHMARHLMDSVSYTRTGDRNHTTLTKRCALRAGSQ